METTEVATSKVAIFIKHNAKDSVKIFSLNKFTFASQNYKK